LIAVPILVWLFVGWLWDYFLLSDALGEFLGRVLSTIIFAVLVILAILEATAKTHVGNTLWVRTKDGMEAVGDPVLVNGPDWRTVFVLAILAALFLLFGVFRIGKKSEKRVSR
jgi:ABC-type Na+ efflux pump permease subunit